jgi:hypothetical protein
MFSLAHTVSLVAQRTRSESLMPDRNRSAGIMAVMDANFQPSATCYDTSVRELVRPQNRSALTAAPSSLERPRGMGISRRGSVKRNANHATSWLGTFRETFLLLVLHAALAFYGVFDSGFVFPSFWHRYARGLRCYTKSSERDMWHVGIINLDRNGTENDGNVSGL